MQDKTTKPKAKKQIKFRDLKAKKDAKGGTAPGGGNWGARQGYAGGGNWGA